LDVPFSIPVVLPSLSSSFHFPKPSSNILLFLCQNCQWVFFLLFPHSFFCHFSILPLGYAIPQ
jgi:hypothetical protein